MRAFFNLLLGLNVESIPVPAKFGGMRCCDFKGVAELIPAL
jgi:hypothetical protein